MDIIKKGFRADDYEGSGGTDWVLCKDNGETDEEVCDELGMYSFSNGPGRNFGRFPIIRRQGGRILVTQYVGLDI